MKRNAVLVLVTAGFAALLYWGSPASAQSGPSLGAAQSFAVLGGTAVTVAGTGSNFSGDVGVSPGTSITGLPAGGTFVPPFGTHANDAAAIAAQSSTTALYTTLAGTGGATPLGAELGGRVIGPGIYSFTSTANIAATTALTLSGAGTYIFKVGSAITANVGSNVILGPGVSACNVFWQVTSAATLNGVTFAGTVVAQAAVTLGVGAALNGRALTTALGAVSMDGTNTVGGCSAAPPPPPACPVITLSPPSLPNGTVGVAYNQTITANGGTASPTFTFTGALPPGLTSTSTGSLTGTPTAPGSFTFSVISTDANSCSSIPATYTIVILAAPVPPPVCPVITLAPALTPNGTVGVAYSQTFVATGGAAPYAFGTTAGALPPGLTLTAGGVLSGTPTVAGTYTFTMRATDANGCSGSLAYTIIITPVGVPPPPVCPVITFGPETLPNGTVGVPYSQALTGSGGTGPYVFTGVNGAFPPGVFLMSPTVLSGTPTVAGSSTFTIRVTDANGCFAERSFTVLTATAVPTLPQAFVVLLALGLTGVGYVRLRRRARG